jgi:hypothetical protein
MRHLGDAPAQELAHLGAARTHREFQLCRGRNHIGGLAGMQRTDRDHRHVVRVHLARHQGLVGQHQVRGHHDRVHRGVRHRAVAALALQRDHHGVRRAVDHTGQESETPGRKTRLVVPGIDGVAREAREQALVDHLAPTLQALFSRLKYQVYGAVERARGRQHLGHCQQCGGVSVMATGVHAPRRAAGIRQTGGLCHGQRVHVGAQAQAAGASARAQATHHAGAGQAPMHHVAPALQAFGHQITGGEFLVTELRVGMDLVPDGQHLGQAAGDLGQDGGGNHGWGNPRNRGCSGAAVGCHTKHCAESVGRVTQRNRCGADFAWHRVASPLSIFCPRHTHARPCTLLHPSTHFLSPAANWRSPHWA